MWSTHVCLFFLSPDSEAVSQLATNSTNLLWASWNAVRLVYTQIECPLAWLFIIDFLGCCWLYLHVHVCIVVSLGSLSWGWRMKIWSYICNWWHEILCHWANAVKVFLTGTITCQTFCLLLSESISFHTCVVLPSLNGKFVGCCAVCHVCELLLWSITFGNFYRLLCLYCTYLVSTT